VTRPQTREAIEERTRYWLEQRYREALARIASDHRNVWGPDGRPRRLGRFQFQEIQRKLKIFRWLDRLHFDSFIDVGSGFDIYPKLVHERYGVPAYFSDFAHSMNLPYGGDASGKLDRAVTSNVIRLPFADRSFDVVLASEVLEHLIRPIEAIAELLRISRRYVIMTSLEALARSRWSRMRSHWKVDVRREHVERNFLLLHEFEAIFGPDWRHENLLYDPHLPASVLDTEERQQAAYGSIRDHDTMVAALRHAVSEERHVAGAMGILLVKSQPGADLAERADGEEHLARWLIDKTAEFERFTVELATRIRDGTAELADRNRPVDPGWLARLRCPDCRARLHRARGGVHCSGCGLDFPSECGVPILFPRRLRCDDASSEETLVRICGDDARRRRVVGRIMRRLRRHERLPGRLRRAAWHLERAIGLY
jgi:uncharacterized protein YbaR (Trm112 family)